jgi:hypothetical protein
VRFGSSGCGDFDGVENLLLECDVRRRRSEERFYASQDVVVLSYIADCTSRNLNVNC